MTNGFKKIFAKTPDRSLDPPEIFSDERIQRIRIRGQARRLTELCLVCDVIEACVFGRRLRSIFKEFCEPMVGDDFRRCAKCPRTLDNDCAIDRNGLAQALHEQLGRCNVRRNFDMPLTLMRFDLMHCAPCG